VVQYKVIVQKEMERMCCNDYGKANANDSDNEQGLDIQVMCLIVMNDNDYLIVVVQWLCVSSQEKC